VADLSTAKNKKTKKQKNKPPKNVAEHVAPSFIPTSWDVEMGKIMV
jgi:hypothetical protein